MTTDDWIGVLHALGVRLETASAWAPAFAELLPGTRRAPGLSGGKREIAAFVPQIVHESWRLERLEENLNYRAERLLQIWPRRFKTIESARPFENKPQLLAERVYGGRLGNDQPGDGWRYRGRGLLMITGKDNYELVQAVTGDPVVDFPDLMKTPKIALRAAIAWWEDKIDDEIVGNDDLVSAVVNGGEVGLEERRRLGRIAREVMFRDNLEEAQT